MPVAAIGPLLSATFAARVLTGADVGLERATPRQRPGWRAAHAAGGLALVVLPTAMAGAAGLDPAATLAVVRNGVGLFGLMLLFSTVIGGPGVWMPACGYVAFVLTAAPHDDSAGAAWWAWPAQPGTTGMTWLVAAALLIIGSAVYLRRDSAV
ncbi:hypothetical protein FHX34_102869 [Actinoplanes teichomyceticus]|uniref:Uncharacterized protein n=1 Tax=Actinoplanes teichomyceticus TaxID=1867 RepID=A0A561WKC2_ACTTI|nr:hypothetical protein FHX34_102869 [Actinoplanes teichomyceticus]GIF12834.1 hypothetical protein Ate01nite_28660 [Actinoplanes teichomyceticus]